MRRLLAAALLALAAPVALAAPAPVLRALLVIEDDYKDPEQNQIARGVRMDLGTVTQVLSMLDRRGIAKVEKTVVQGRKATLPAVKTAVEALKSGPDDVLFVYFSGHGGMENKRTFLVTAEGETLERAWLQKALDAKPARLRLVVTDACSNDVDGVVTARSFRKSSPALEGKFDEIYRALFTGYSGTLHVSASSEGEFAFSDDGLGGYFTHYFFKEALLKNPKPTWEENFQAARAKTMQMFGRMPAEERGELAAQGVKNQTPKAFVLPRRVGDAKPPVTPEPVKPPAKPVLAVIRNDLGKPFEFFLDHNAEDAEWTEEKLEKKQLAKGKSLSLPAGAIVAFEAGDELYSYELDEGRFVFARGDGGLPDLFLEEDAPAKRDAKGPQWKKFFTGTWTWEDAEDRMQMRFGADGSFTVRSPDDAEDLEGGTWKTLSRKLDGEEFPILALVATDEEDGVKSTITLEYAFESDDRNLATLVLVRQLVDGKEVPIEEDEDDEDELGGVVVLTREK